MAKKSSYRKELFAIVLMAFGILVFLGLSDNLGELGKYSNVFFLRLFGIGIWIFPVVLLIVSAMILASYKWHISSSSFLGILLLFFSFQGILHVLQVPFSQADEPLVSGGGMFGVAFSLLPRVMMGDTGTIVFLIALLLIGFLLTFRLSLLQVVMGLVYGGYFLVGSIPKNTLKPEKITKPLGMKNADAEPTLAKKIIPYQNFEIKRGIAENKKHEEITEGIKKEEKHVRPEDQDFSHWKKPTIDLLEKGSSVVHIPDKQLHEMGAKIVEKLGYFQVKTTMNSAVVGPTVTQFALEPEENVKLSRITGLKNELALALSAESVRIEAPIPGKNLVGIEIPNQKRSAVYMREILQSSVFQKTQGSLRLCIGKDVSGNPIVESLDDMPHLLIAGSTGSGKSVGMNAFLISMLFENSPADLRFIMVDPKRVELMPYEGIPHLLTPVITEASKALSALRWCVAEMMRRLDAFSKVGARNIGEYNSFIEKKQKKQSETSEHLANSEKVKDEKALKSLPKIVIVIDELADLMMREHKKETEGMICRIAQMARAVGMHLIIATQRPSVDVITGLIKANIPTRIAFTVTSAVDSRTVLDCIGAEDLLGRGDMLFLHPRLSKPKRVQGIYISGAEIEKVVHHLKINISDDAFFEDYISLDDHQSETTIAGMSMGSASEGKDDMLQEALEVVRSTGKASASLLQRRLSVGYARAARLLDEMEEAGYIGPSKGAKPRDIYL